MRAIPKETSNDKLPKTKGTLLKRMSASKYLYLMSLPAVVYYLVLVYLPMFGISIAFTDYDIGSGIMGFFTSKWNNFENFKIMFNSIFFTQVLRNTLTISLLKLFFGFPLPIIIALMLNEINNKKFKNFVQGVSYLPHFLSWVVVAAMIYQLMSPITGDLNRWLEIITGSKINVFTNERNFMVMLIVSHLWKGTGWGTIVYVAAISNIDPTLYEAADIDGAKKLHKLRFITLPCIAPTIIIVFILNLSGILSAGFDQIFNLYNPMVMNVADILDTYVYREGMVNSRYGFSTAVGLFKSAIGVVLIVGSDRFIRRLGYRGIF